MLGLDGAGKTTILYKLKLGSVESTTPTIGFNVEQIQYKNINFTVWDIGGQDRLRPLWRHYYNGVNAMIFVIDINDTTRYKEMLEEVIILQADDHLKNVPFLFFANKCDLPNRINFSVLYQDLSGIIKNGQFHIESTNALNGHGLYEGIDWLNSVLRKKK